MISRDLPWPSTTFHNLPWQVDLDIGAAGESLEVTKIKAGLHPAVPDLRGWATKYVERALVPREGAGLSTFVPDVRVPGVWAVADADAAKPHDDAPPTSPPGYAIKVGPTVGQSLPDDHDLP